jgi:serine/threonine protein kinase/formylglycine-generating enzyme required for sulfatase activity
MAGRGPHQEFEPGARGQALLVEGFAASGDVAAPASTMGQLCEVLLASRAFESVRYLTPRAAARNRPSRLALRFHIEKLIAAPSPFTLVALSGQLVAGEHGIALDTSASLGQPYPSDSVPLPWLAEGLASRERLLLFLEFDAGDSRLGAEEVVALFRSSAAAQLIVAGPIGSSLVRSVVDGLRGGAAMAKSGMVSFNSLRSYLASGEGVAVAGTGSNMEFLVPPSPLALWGFTTEPGGATAARDLAGRTLPGQVHLRAVLDSGGFGTVYAARQLTLERDVAVKVVEAPTIASAQLFVNEVRAIGRLDHPNVVRIYQADVTADGFPFCAMELLTGRTLRRVMEEEGVVGESRALDLVVQILAALAAAHDAGVIHGDVKPDNLVLVGEGDSERLVLVDFGLASLQAANARSVGGSPPYMAPEQLLGRLDRRSDQFAAGLILHELLTGDLPRRRPTGMSIHESIEPRLHAILSRALAQEVEDRFPSASAFAAALAGRAEADEEAERVASPFRALSGFVEADEGTFFGRSEEAGSLVTQLLVHPALVLTAPSGVGKSSLLRAAVIPRLRRLGFTSSYHRCRPEADLPPHARAGEVTIYDQLETLFLAPSGERQLDQLLSDLGNSQDRTVILSVREDFLARLIERMTPWALPPIVRLPPLSRAGAEEAIVRPLEARRIKVDAAAVDRLLGELQRAAAELGPRMGWGTGDFVYPPHLQLIGSTLYERIRDHQRLDASHLDGIRFSDVISDHLRHLLDGELSEDAGRIARSLLAGLIGPDDTRVDRSEEALVAALPEGSDREQAVSVLEFLRGRGLLLPIRVDGKRGWELAHDSLVPRVVAWLDRQDLDRRRTGELVRHHMARSTTDQLYLLPRAALREIDRHAGLLAELDKLSAPRGISASRLVWLSRRALRRRAAALFLLAAATASVVGYLAHERLVQHRAQVEQQMLSAGNLGRFELTLEPFDWDLAAARPVAVDASTLETPRLVLYDRDREHPDDPGAPLRTTMSPVRRQGAAFAVDVEVRGGPAYIAIAGRGRPGTSCTTSWIPLRWLPGYVDRPSHPTLRLVYPTCAASLAGTVQIPAGEFVRGGLGDPPSSIPDLTERAVVRLPAYRIQRTEVTNGAYSHYASMAEATGRAMPAYPTSGVLANAGTADRPVTNIDFSEARDYCQFLGLDLPSGDQWEKAARGGLFLDRAAEVENPFPERSQPWGPEPWTSERANLDPVSDGFEGVAPVGSFPAGASPYGLVDMAGNVHEWVTDHGPQGGRHRSVRGGGWEVVPAAQHHYLQYGNARDERYRDFAVGLRCAGAGDG